MDLYQKIESDNSQNKEIEEVFQKVLNYKMKKLDARIQIIIVDLVNNHLENNQIKESSNKKLIDWINYYVFKTGEQQ